MSAKLINKEFNLVLSCKDTGYCKGGVNESKRIAIDKAITGAGPNTEFGMMMFWNVYKQIDQLKIERFKYLFTILDHSAGINIHNIVHWLEEHKGRELDFERKD